MVQAPFIHNYFSRHSSLKVNFIHDMIALSIILKTFIKKRSGLVGKGDYI